MSDINSSLPVKTEVDVDERLQTKLVDYTTPSQGMEIDTDGDAHVKAKLRDDNGDAFGTESNPVYTVGAEDPGAEIEDYQTTASLAKDAVANHDYTVGGGVTFKGVSLFVSASGEFKVVLQRETAAGSGTYTTFYVGFAQSSSPFLYFPLNKIFKQVTGAKVRVAITNRDNAQDVYSTLVGIEV